MTSAGRWVYWPWSTRGGQAKACAIMQDPCDGAVPVDRGVCWQRSAALSDQRDARLLKAGLRASLLSVW